MAIRCTPSRVCKKCFIRKNITAFPARKARGVSYRRHTCGACKASGWRKRNPDIHKAIAKAARDRHQSRRPEIKHELLMYINQHKCHDCGYRNEVALAFHHIKKHTKEFSISKGMSKMYSMDRLKKEVIKCEVLCANCHSIRHRSHTYKRCEANSERCVSVKRRLMIQIGSDKCECCGESDIKVLAFHHTKNKRFSLSSGIVGRKSFAVLLREARKCSVLCLNCHLVEHAAIRSRTSCSA